MYAHKMNTVLHRTSRKLIAAIIVGFVLIASSGCSDIYIVDPNVKYIAFGDSMVNGPSDLNFWEILRDDLDEPADSFANQGQSSETAGEGVQRLKIIFDNEIYPNATVLLYWQGAAAVVDFVRNHDPFLLYSPNEEDYPFADDLDDLLDQVQSDVEQAIALALNAGLTVYVANYYDLRPNIGNCDAMPLELLLPTQASRINEYIDLLNDRIGQAVSNQQVTLVDIASENDQIAQSDDNYFDCTHLSEQGNAIAADVFFDTINGNAP